MQRNGKSRRKTEEMLKLRDAALQLGISFPTIKQWIYKKKIRSIRTAGGHHRIPESEVDRLLFRTRGKTEKERNLVIRRVSGRNQLVGRIDAVRISGLMAEIAIPLAASKSHRLLLPAPRVRHRMRSWGRASSIRPPGSCPTTVRADAY
jgi:excisionase family DNA binding protein